MSISREKLEKKFKEEYNRLNDQQRKAVDKIEGPVMVIAGPGTGKTQILAARIGKILLDSDTDPGSILCLTYTDAGVIAMRKRLLEFIGPDAYKVNIYTFHAFCNDVIQENLSLFEKTAMDPISDLERIELFKQLIDTFPKNHPLKRYRGDVYFEINNLQSLFSTMKKEGWSPAFINEKVDSYIKSLPERDEFICKRATGSFKKGDIRTDKIEEATEKIERLRAAVNEFDRYQQLMRTNNRYDFDDMINWVLLAFETNPALLMRYQEQFLYVLVDEYQDTSGTQNKLVELLINYWDKPNVFVVGDDDQSIFRFQGANVENMEAFANHYEDDLLKVVLVNNYRSTQLILDISKTLINRNNERLINKMEGLSKELLCSNEKLKGMLHLPAIHEYDTQKQEMISITLQVEALLAKGIQPGRIAIIYKENKYGEELTRYFNLRNIPVYSKRKLNILSIPLAQKIITLFKYLASEHFISYSGDELLFELLHFDWFQIPPIEIAKLTMDACVKNNAVAKSSLRQLLNEKAHQPDKDLFTPGMHEGLKKASIVIEQLIADVPNETLQCLFENMVRKAGILTSIMLSNEKIWLMQVLTGLFDFVKEETRRQPTMNVHQLVNILELMEKEKLALPLVQVCGTDKGVNLLTAHGSKGLEFEYLFFVGANAMFWEKKRKPGGGYSFPDTMFTSKTVDSKLRDEEELRRLFYVALTRAEQHLSISYCCFKDDGKEIESSMFIAEILDLHLLPKQKQVINDEQMLEFQSLFFQQAQSPEIERMEEDYINRVLEKFIMNVTALNNYLKCPLEFYFKNLVRIPSPKNENTEFGSAIHYALEQLFKKMLDKKVFPGLKEFISDFEWFMNRHRESFTLEQFNRRWEYGQEVLTNYYNKYILTWPRIVKIEGFITPVTVNGVPIRGKLDKMEFDGKSVNVVDYKTGDPDKAKPKLLPPNEKEPNGGDYWRQAVFYKILVDNYDLKDWKVVSTEFDFIEPDKKKNYQKTKLVITSQDITSVTQQITTVWQKIQQHDFYTGCGKEDCHWCQFVKSNNMAVAMHELTAEDEND